jgi:thiol-disulfide isomerase/thioredoxin
MVKTLSIMLPLGTLAPHFCLPDVVTQKPVHFPSGATFKATLICFICNHCPFVKHINQGLVQLAQDYLPQGVQFLAISSNDVVHYPEDSPEKMAMVAKELDYPFPYLYDETQEVAKAYQAACTPDFFVFNENLALTYRGQMDDSRPGNHIPVTGDSIRAALDALLVGAPINVEQKPSIGCNIKWK